MNILKFKIKRDEGIKKIQKVKRSINEEKRAKNRKSLRLMTKTKIDRFSDLKFMA